MNTSNTLCRYTVVMVCGMCILIVGIFVKNVEAGNQIPGAIVNEESVQSTSDANLNFVLVGTVLSDEGKSVAIFEDNKTNSQKFHRLGDTIEGGRITKILKDRVILTENNVKVELKIGYGTGNGQSQTDYNGEDDTITTHILKPLTGNTDLSELEVNVSQIYEGGAEVLEVEEDGLLSKLGLRSGDIIRNINHRETNDDLSFSEVVAQDIENGQEQLRLELERDGEKKVIYNMFMEDQATE